MNWLPYIPLDTDVQVSKSADWEACVSYSFIHILEMVLRKKTGYFFEFSERAMAKLSDTTPYGNTLNNIIDAANQYGVLLASDWPPLTYSGNYEDINWATYYLDIPEAVLKRAYRVRCGFQKLSPGQVATALETAPLWTIIKTSGGQNHIVAQINNLQYYDSYETRVKWFQPAEPIISQHQLIINIESMPNAQFVHKAGTQEFGFFLPALSEDGLKDKALNLSLPITNPDGTVDFSKAVEVTGLQ